MIRISLRFFGAVVCGMIIAEAAYGVEQDLELIDLFRSSNRAALERIQTIKGRMRFVLKMSFVPMPSPTVEVEYQRSGSNWRQKEVSEKTTKERSRLGERIVAVDTRIEPDGSKWIGAAISPETHSIDGVYFWSAALCDLPSPIHGTLDSFLNGGHVVSFAGYRGTGVNRLGWLEIQLSGDRLLAIAVDPMANYMIRNVDYINSQLQGKRVVKLRSTYEVSEFAEVVPGIFFPKEVTVRHFSDGREVATSVSTFSNIEVNRRLPANSIQVRIPAGASVTDRIKGTVYTVDAQGRPVSTPKRFVAAPNRVAQPPIDPYLPTSDEGDRPWWHHVALAILVVLLAVAGVYYSRLWWSRRLLH